MVSQIDSARLPAQTRSRSEPERGFAAQDESRGPTSADADVRLSLSETAKRLSSASMHSDEAPRRSETDRVEASGPGEPEAVGETASDGRRDFERGAGEHGAGSVAAYRTSTRSEVGARVSIRV